MAKLILVRHGKSDWNKQGLWTGWTDVDLAEEGYEEARKAGEALKDLEIHRVHTSLLKRTQQTLDGIVQSLGMTLDSTPYAALNERDYGIYTGKNKWQVKETIGEEQFQSLRRGWDVTVPEGETLKDVHDRVVPYYQNDVLPLLKAGENTLLVAHGNSLRALIKHVEGLDEVTVCELEFGTGEVYCYDIDENGTVVGKEIRNGNDNKLKV